MYGDVFNNSDPSQILGSLHKPEPPPDDHDAEELQVEGIGVGSIAAEVVFYGRGQPSTATSIGGSTTDLGGREILPQAVEVIRNLLFICLHAYVT